MTKTEQVDRSAIASQGGDARDKALTAKRKTETPLSLARYLGVMGALVLGGLAGSMHI